MPVVPVIWAVWIASILLLIAVSIYASRVSKNEEDQLFLSDASSSARSQQAAIADKVSRLQPIRKGAIAIVGLTSLCVLGYYVLDIVKQFNY